MNTNHSIAKRRYDIDWLRAIALVLLILYHVVLSFQPWAHEILFMQNEGSLANLFYPNQDHPDVAISLHNMGAILKSLGDYEVAKPYYPDQDHPYIVISLN